MHTCKQAKTSIHLFTHYTHTHTHTHTYTLVPRKAQPFDVRKNGPVQSL